MSSYGGGLTRKDRRQAAREQRRAVEAALLADAARRRRLIALGGSLGIVIAVVVVAIAVGGRSAKGIVVGAQARAAAAEVSSLLAGIPESASTLGDPKAPVTLEYFGDLECPYCQMFTLDSLPTLIASYVRGGRLQIEYRSIETATRDPTVFATQQVAALAAGRQDLLWYYVELFYREQGQEDSGYVTDSYLQGLASQVPGLNLARWREDRGDTALADQLTSDQQAANEAGLQGTPSFLLGRTGATLEPFDPASLTDPSAFTGAIDKLLG